MPGPLLVLFAASRAIFGRGPIAAAFGGTPTGMPRGDGDRRKAGGTLRAPSLHAIGRSQAFATLASEVNRHLRCPTLRVPRRVVRRTGLPLSDQCHLFFSRFKSTTNGPPPGKRWYNQSQPHRRVIGAVIQLEAETLMSDEIRIKGLFLRTIIGINDDEREQKQDVRINLALTVDTRPAARSDEIDDAVNYRTITKDVIDLVENSKFFLVERMAEEIARLCLRDPRVEQVRVSIEKPAALRFARSVGVVIRRSRSDV
jgi:D-erythro-7,8-dihydroneopterin triphosphate epimerase